MAVDEALLHSAQADGVCTLRWYRWDRPTVSLGYFQRFEGSVPPSLAQLPCVRRLSGGGAIVHDRELTYSCTLPATHPLARAPQAAYAAIHGRIVSLLLEFDLPARLRKGENADASRNGEWLCFARRDSCDVVADGWKILGSAQRRRKGAVLQHGSLILRRSTLAPQFPGLLDIAHRPDEPPHLWDRLADGLAQTLGDLIVRGQLTVGETDRAHRYRPRYSLTTMRPR